MIRILSQAALLVVLTMGPTITAWAGPPVTPGSVAGRNSFTILLHGADHPAAPPTMTPEAIIVPVAGALNWPAASIRYPHPLHHVTDIVVAQHDPETIWVVAHLTGPSVGLRIRAARHTLSLTFEAPAAVASPVPRPRVTTTPFPTARFSVRWVATPVADAAAQLARLVGSTITVAPGVQGAVTLQLSDATFADVLRALASRVHARVVGSDGAYQIVPQP